MGQECALKMGSADRALQHPLSQITRDEVLPTRGRRYVPVPGEMPLSLLCPAPPTLTVVALAPRLSDEDDDYDDNSDDYDEDGEDGYVAPGFISARILGGFAAGAARMMGGLVAGSTGRVLHPAMAITCRGCLDSTATVDGYSCPSATDAVAPVHQRCSVRWRQGRLPLCALVLMVLPVLLLRALFFFMLFLIFIFFWTVLQLFFPAT